MKGAKGARGPYLVYQMWAGDQCIYVGMTKNLPARLYAHKRTQPWWGDVTNVTTTPHEWSGDAHYAERELIVAIRPEHNRQWNPDHDPTVLDRLAFREFVESVTPEAEAS